MKSALGSFSWLAWLSLGLLVLWSPPGFARDLEQEFATCRRQLQQIGEAIAAYRQANGGEFPPTLTLLHEKKYANNPAIFRCPTAYGGGESGPANPNLINPSHGEAIVVGYNWEMSIHDPPFWEGQRYNYSFRRFKELQGASPIGEHLPVVRCTHHKVDGEIRALNLTAGGKVYESGEYWEANFASIIPGVRMTPDMVHLAHVPMAELIRRRPAQATEAMLDLRTFYNARFEDPWIRSHPGDEWLQFPYALKEGLLSFRDVAFEPAGIIQLNGQVTKDRELGYQRLMYPTNAPPIPIARPVRVLHVLGSVLFPSSPGSVVARIDFDRADGRSLARWEWKYGQDVAQALSPVRLEAGADPRLRVVWAEAFPAGRQAGMFARLFHLRFENPDPTVLVTQIRFSTGDTGSAPMIAAITLE